MELLYIRMLDRYDEQDNNLVLGILHVISEEKVISMNVRENILYLLQAGTYRLVYEHSPKFKRKLWEVKGAYPRKEIKFHTGSRSEHSKGCFLLRSNDLNNLHSALNSGTRYKIRIINI